MKWRVEGNTCLFHEFIYKIEGMMKIKTKITYMRIPKTWISILLQKCLKIRFQFPLKISVTHTWTKILLRCLLFHFSFVSCYWTFQISKALFYPDAICRITVLILWITTLSADGTLRKYEENPMEIYSTHMKSHKYASFLRCYLVESNILFLVSFYCIRWIMKSSCARSA